MENSSCGLNELREVYRAFFETKAHLRLASYPLVPAGDKSLLLINSGMAPLKPYFTGAEEPPRKRVTTSQKCIRTGDIENVGKTARHGTFFEMLGNFSFGDYFKREAISWAWEFCIDVLKLPKERLYISVYHEDEESLQIWNREIGIELERIFKMGKEDNFWEVGLGPCGPCSEIYFDRGPQYGCSSPGCSVGCDCDRYLEFWNLVFTQFNKEEDGSYSDLPNPNIDTGMGLERLAMMMQDVPSIFDVDTVKSIRDCVCTLSGKAYGQKEKTDVSIRVITDHMRSITFMLSDGVLPSSEGRGYVLRRLLRRAVRHGKLLGLEGAFLSEVALRVIECSQEEYVELGQKREYITKIIRLEEERFGNTIDQGGERLAAQALKLREAKMHTLPGEEAFHLYDTYGFPLELTLEILAEEGLSVDEKGFEEHMMQQRERARAARSSTGFMGTNETVFDKLEIPATVFEGYDTLGSESVVLAIIAGDETLSQVCEGQHAAIVLNKTPFYAEAGGQAGDVGFIRLNGADATFRVDGTIRVSGGAIAHTGILESGCISVGDSVNASVDAAARQATCRNHSATHLLHKALRNTLGKHVEQAGSLVSPGRLRFDFTHFQPLSPKQLQEIEDAVNEDILQALPVQCFTTHLDEAKNLGAMALFGEKYGDIVRVVKMGNSIELCGGTHCSNTGQVGLFRIVSEASVAAGVRRIEAITGTSLLGHLRDLEKRISEASAILKTTPANLAKQASSVALAYKEATLQLEQLQNQQRIARLGETELRIDEAGGHSVVSAIIEGQSDAAALKEMADKLKQKHSIVILAGHSDGKAGLCVMATDEAVRSGAKSGEIVKTAIALLNGRGGGKPTMAMAGGIDNGNIPQALDAAHSKAREQLIMAN